MDSFFLITAGYAYSYCIDNHLNLKQFLKLLLAKFEEYNTKLTDYAYDFMYKHFPDSTDPLLPDFNDLKYPDLLPTLVVDLDKTVVHLQHDRRSGWRVLKRPGADRFFKELMNYYEIVVWSDDNYPVAQEVMLMWGVPVIGCIHRDQCKRKKGHYVKDLYRLGRRLDRTIIIDHDPYAFMNQPENGIQVKEYTGDIDDNELETLIDFLKNIAACPDDVRTQIKKYGGGDVNIGRRFLVQKAEQDKKSEARRYFGKAFGRSNNQSFNASRPGFSNSGNSLSFTNVV